MSFTPQTSYFFSSLSFSVPLTFTASRLSDMSGNTKYQSAPQRDSFEESNYTQAPPSYQDVGSSNDGLLGGPRGEDDNVPDDFKVSLYHPLRATTRTKKIIANLDQFGGSVAEATLPIRMQFVRKVYSILYVSPFQLRKMR